MQKRRSPRPRTGPRHRLPRNPGDVIFIQQEAAMGLIMARNNIVRIEEIPGKYHVKKLELGTIIKTDK